MSPPNVVARVCGIPGQLRARQGASVVQLLDESGYRAAPASLTAEAVARCLRTQPDLIDAWLAYSQDKRTSTGWYFTQTNDGGFEIGFFPRGERVQVAERERACAEFIVREVRAIAGA